ncbi:hypothetical protein OROHE_014945 [Orobanche hederae]
MWSSMENAIRKVGENVVGVSSGKFNSLNEAWWWNVEVQKIVKAKQALFKELMSVSEEEERNKKKEAYKVARREAKKAVAKAKGKAYEEMYKSIDTKEGENGIFKLTKSQESGRRDLGPVRFIKDDLGHVLVNNDAIKESWSRYIFMLLNKVRGNRIKVEQGEGLSSVRYSGSCEHISDEDIMGAV